MSRIESGIAILPRSCSGAASRTSRTIRSPEPDAAGEQRRQVADALRVLVRVVVAVLGRQREPPQALELRGVVLAAARDRLGGDDALELRRALAQRVQLHQRAQPPRGDGVERIARPDDLEHRDHRRPELEPERVQTGAQPLLAAVERQHGVGRRARDGGHDRQRIGLADLRLGACRRQSGACGIDPLGVLAGDEDPQTMQGVHNRSIMADTTDDPRIGTVIAGYRIEERVGRGGMGVVYRAEHLNLRRRAAIKIIAPDLAESEGFRERFTREARIAAALQHPNIVTVYDAGEVDGILYLAMQYIEGNDLSAVLRKDGRLRPYRAIDVCRQVASALDAAHAHGPDPPRRQARATC